MRISIIDPGDGTCYNALYCPLSSEQSYLLGRGSQGRIFYTFGIHTGQLNAAYFPHQPMSFDYYISKIGRADTRLATLWLGYLTLHHLMGLPPPHEPPETLHFWVQRTLNWRDHLKTA